jgi:hypothetical protein
MTDAAHPGTIAAEYLPDLSSLSIDHRATFRVGQIMRLTVVMERTLRDVHARLQAVPPNQLRNGPDGFGALCSETQSYLRLSGFPNAGAADAALEDIRTTYRERNRFAHDHLLPSDRGQWDRLSLENTLPLKHVKQVDEEALRDAVLDVIRAQWRLHALDNLVAHWQGASGEPLAEPDVHHDGWAAILQGEFQLTSGGGARITSEL